MNRSSAGDIMITERKVSVFNAGCDAMVNTVNCKGIMGAGLALEFKMRYPELFEQYQYDCKNRKVKIGEIRKYVIDGAIILNFPTKYDWKYPSQLSYVEKGLDYFLEHYKEWGVSTVAMPPLGCNNGQLDINVVKKAIHDKLADIDMEVVICEDPGYPEGKEKEMLDKLKSSNIGFLSKMLKLNKKQKEALENNVERIKRFYELFYLEGIGEKSYEKLFRFCYEETKDSLLYTSYL